jgi:hypothetical protein
MAARIEDQFMTAEFDGCVVATARYSSHAAADGQGAWIVCGLPHRLFNRNQAITAMVLTERLAAGYGDDDPFIIEVARGAGPVMERMVPIVLLSLNQASARLRLAIIPMGPIILRPDYIKPPR